MFYLPYYEAIVAAAVQEATPSVQVPAELPQVGGGNRRGEPGESLAYPIHAPLYRPARRATSKVTPPPPQPDEPSAPEVPEIPPLDRVPVEYPFTAADFFKATSEPPPVIRRIAGLCAFKIPLPRLKVAPFVLVHGAVRLRVPAVKLGVVPLRRYRDDAIPLAQGKPELAEVFEEWIVG